MIQVKKDINFLTTSQIAKMMGVHQTTVINWVENYTLKCYKTPGGHRRVLTKNLTNFLDKRDIPYDLS